MIVESNGFSDDRKIETITDIDNYLTSLKKIKDKYLIIFSVKDTTGHSFRPESAGLVKELGLTTDLHNKHGHSFLAVIYKGKILLDELSKTDETLTKVLDIDGVRLSLKSSIYVKENISVIEIDLVEYSLDLRGLNIVVYDTDTYRLIDTVCFDTHVKGNNCYRRSEKTDIKIFQIENRLFHMKKYMEQIEKQNEELKKLVNTNQHRQEMMLWQLYKAAGENTLESKKRFFLSMEKANGTLRKMQRAGLILLIQFDRICREHNIKYWLNFGSLLGAVRHKGFIPWDDDTDVGMLRDDILKLQNVMNGNNDFYIDESFTVRNINPSHMDHNYQFRFVKTNPPYCLDIFVYDYSDDLSNKTIASLRSIKKNMKDESLSLVQSLGKRDFTIGKEYGEEFGQLFNKYYAEQCSLLGTNTSEKNLIWALDNVESDQGLRSSSSYNEVFPLSEIEFENHVFLAPKNPEEYVERLYDDIYGIPSDILSHIHFRLSDEQVTVLDELLDKYGDCI